MNISFAKNLTKEKKEKIVEMAKWLFPECEISNPSIDALTVKTIKDNITVYEFPSYMDLLVFLIPKKLEMDFVIIDPGDYESLFNQISERYDMYVNISEESVKKSKYSSTAMGYDNDYFQNCMC